jgi:hypothetical protein
MRAAPVPCLIEKGILETSPIFLELAAREFRPGLATKYSRNRGVRAAVLVDSCPLGVNADIARSPRDVRFTRHTRLRRNFRRQFG